MSTSYLKLKDFLQLTARLESAHPGFGASYLGLGVAADITLHPPVVSSSLSTHTSSDKQHLTRRRRCTLVTPNNHPPILHTSLSSVQNHRSQPLCKVQIPCCSSSFLLSEYLAQIDEVTTWELVLNDDKRNRAGVSVQLHAQWTTNYDHIQKHPDKNEEEDPSNIRDWDRRPDDRRGAMFVELIPNVIKIGRNIALVDAQVVAVTTPASGAIENNNDHQSRHQILSASHIKYMPMGFVTDWALRHWKLLQLYSQYCMSSGAAVVAARNHKTRTDPPMSRISIASTGCNDDDDDDFHQSHFPYIAMACQSRRTHPRWLSSHTHGIGGTSGYDYCCNHYESLARIREQHSCVAIGCHDCGLSIPTGGM
jgi:hypothetical protein